MATTNPWKAFEGLLPKANRVIGTVARHNSNGTSTITLRDDSYMVAKGAVIEVGKKVLIEGLEVVRDLPTLPIYKMQV